MSKVMIEAFIKAQYSALNAKNNKERLGYMVAGIKDGKFYDKCGNIDYGTFDVDAPDAEFITQDDVELTRVTSTKILSVTENMNTYFREYNKEDTEVEDTDTEVEDTDTEVEDVVDYEALETECKKAIKKGNFPKAQKILVKLNGQTCYKKLAKKLKKATV